MVITNYLWEEQLREGIASRTFESNRNKCTAYEFCGFSVCVRSADWGDIAKGSEAKVRDTHTYTYKYTYTYTYAYTCTYTYTYTYTYACTYTYIHIYIYICIYTHDNIIIIVNIIIITIVSIIIIIIVSRSIIIRYISLSLYIYIYTHTHAHTHTYITRQVPKPLTNTNDVYSPELSLCPIPLLTLLDSSFPGNSLWAWEFHPL